MFKVTISAGSARGLDIKVMNFEDKVSAMGFITIQLNKILNNPNMTTWDIAMQEINAKRA